MATQKESIIPVPDKYLMTFKRLLNRLPKKKRRDKKLQETLLVCMKLGGEELTRQRIKLEKVKFAEKPELFKRRVPIVPKETLDPTQAEKPAAVTDETAAAAETQASPEETGATKG